MKRVLPKITAGILLAMAVTACSGQQETSQVSGSVEVLTPVNDSKAGYALKFIELSGLDSLREVSGRFVRFFISPRILDNRLNGPAPQGRFIKNTDGKYIPANDQSQQLAAIYNHMQNLAKLDEELGAGGVNHWPRDIGVAVRESSGLVNNALYDGTTDSILIVPYTKDDLPIAVNGGILAHEHFHSLYFKLVMKGNKESTDDTETGSIHDRRKFLLAAGIEEDSTQAQANPRVGGDLKIGHGRVVTTSDKVVKRYYNRYFQRGLNEGLADFWAWMYTGDPDFIAASLPSEKRKRTLSIEDYQVATLVPAESLRDVAATYLSFSTRADFEDHMLAVSYNLGTKYSRLLKFFTDKAATARGIESQEMRKKVAAWIVASLPVFRQDFLNADANEYYRPTRFLKVLVSAATDITEEECKILASVVNATENSNAATCTKSSDNHLEITEAKL